MSTLAEIEAALPKLTVEEIDSLTRKLQRVRAERQPKQPRSLVQWWSEMEHMSPEEAEAFARDIEAGRAEMNRPVHLPEWES